ncbi:hypothetical protein ZIOFF_062488 [Zingiber officinale]|uniref:Uncharacterized protein n=1 Tax=Zingiber officinale TaxID=94328 RepID=A0A8J5KAT7_ZINOF|nr:hypothetical protein ZIOFF_062488 [Zingiber officinale]
MPAATSLVFHTMLHSALSNRVLWTTLIAGLVLNGDYLADIEKFRGSRAISVHHNSFAIATVLSASASGSASRPNASLRLPGPYLCGPQLPRWSLLQLLRSRQRQAGPPDIGLRKPGREMKPSPFLSKCSFETIRWTSSPSPPLSTPAPSPATQASEDPSVVWFSGPSSSLTPSCWYYATLRNKRSDPNLVEKGKESLRIQGHICMRNTISYREALSATDPIENPSIGFAKPSDYQAEPLRDIQQELRKQNNPPFPQDLVSKLQNLSLGPSKPKEKPGKLRQAARRLGRQLTGGASSRYTLEQQLEPEA